LAEAEAEPSALLRVYFGSTAKGGIPMNHRGVDYNLTMIEPGYWRWEFRVGERLQSGRTRASQYLAIRRIQMRIASELRKIMPRQIRSSMFTNVHTFC